MLKQTVSIEECLPPDHLARFVVQTIAQLDLSSIYSAYGAKGWNTNCTRNFVRNACIRLRDWNL
ncbi:hypothetical protein [Chamaesiphon minutus]|uniref:hypothetical protein n=1 Tax=Chamaesiphon minutus TaxID=1173032 RepID=UPI000303644F|nr:hypothetical protein [Chamaesiphon minutus]